MSLLEIKQMIVNKEDQKCNEMFKEISNDLLKSVETNITAVGAPIDSTAQSLLPEDSPLIPIKTTGNGSCLYNAISIGLVGKFQIPNTRYAACNEFSIVL